MQRAEASSSAPIPSRSATPQRPSSSDKHSQGLRIGSLCRIEARVCGSAWNVSGRLFGCPEVWRRAFKGTTIFDELVLYSLISLQIPFVSSVSIWMRSLED